MTDRKTISRPRRRAPGTVPAYLADWFAGGRKPSPIRLHAVPWCALLRTRWLEWAKDHPGAVPPAGFEHLAGEPTAQELDREREARRMLRQGQRLHPNGGPLDTW